MGKSEPEIIKVGPNSRPQEEFFLADEFEVLYGGAAGGGKTAALVMEVLRWKDYADWKGIIFRRTHPQLLGSVLPEMYRYFPPYGGSYNVQEKLWKFPSGATCRLGHMEDPNSWRNYQGHQYNYQGYDELTHFMEPQYVMLGAWCRSSSNLPAFRRGATNPGGPGHQWVKEYFVNTCPPVPDGPPRYSKLAGMWYQPMKPGATYYHINDKGGVSKRKFIPAKVFDNVDLLKNNPNYLNQLLNLPPDRRRALLEGDWDVYEGQFFSQWREHVHIIPYFKIPRSWPAVGGLDYGNITVLEVASRDYEGTILQWLEVYTESEVPSERANKIADALIEHSLWNLDVRYDVNMDISLKNYYGAGEGRPIQIFQSVFKQRMGDKAPRMTPVAKTRAESKNYRVVCNEAFKELIGFAQNKSGQITRRPKFYVTQNCHEFRKEIPALSHPENNPDGEDFEHNKAGIKDHCYDAAKFAFLALRLPIKKQPVRPIETYDEYMEEKVFKKLKKKTIRANSARNKWTRL